MKTTSKSEQTPRRRVHLADSGGELVLKSDLALLLEALRSTRGWTKKRMADELGIAASTLTKLEAGYQFALWERTWNRIVEPLARLMEANPDELRPYGKDLTAEVRVPVAAPPAVADVSAQIHALSPQERGALFRELADLKNEFEAAVGA